MSHQEYSLTRPVSTHRRSRRGRAWIWILVSLAMVCLIGFLALIVAIAAVGLSSPDTSVYPGNQVPTSYLKTAREVGALEQNESPKFFYSDGLMGIKSGFYLVTNTKIAIYSEDGRETPLSVIPLNKITSAELARNESFFEDSEIFVETESGEYYSFPVSSEYDRDKLFFEAIQSKLDVR